MFRLINRALTPKINSKFIQKSNHSTLYNALISSQENFKNNKQINNKFKLLINTLSKTSVQETELTNGFKPYTVRIGVVQSKSIEDGLFLKSILCDPYESSHMWFDKFNELIKTDKNSLIIGYDDKYEQSGCIVGLPSPILNKDLRIIQNETIGENDNSKSLLKRELFNDIEFIKINENDDDHPVDTIELDDIDSIKLNGQNRNEPINYDCHLYIYVKSDSFEMIELNNNYPSLEVINEEMNSIGSKKFDSYNDSSIVVDLIKYNKGNELMMESSKNVSQYLELLKLSKMNSFLFTLNKETSGYNPVILLLNSLLKDIKVDLSKNNNDNLTNKFNELKLEINNLSQSSHFELQSKIQPFLENVLILKFSKISQILLNIDEFPLILSNHLFNSELNIQKSTFNFKKVKCHGSLIESNNKLNYLEGKIDSLLSVPSATSVKEYESLTFNNNSAFKKKIDDIELPKLQNQINELILSNLLKVNLPTFSILTFFYIINYIDINVLISILVLSFLISFNNISKYSLIFFKNFQKTYVENLRNLIDLNSLNLNNKLINKFEKINLLNANKSKNCKELTNEFDKVKTIENELLKK